ncbi:LysE family translocator [Aliamphritea ceti]|uniref:LysE family translocator n=1 Tax=Aliamphritea ceti TaxID=1524258 RepID=UPI0021C3F713|nr:LysE family translocator [Aliamphritea ceti]
MDYVLLTKASVIGLSIAAPVGPIGLLCMQRTLISGAKTGLACGLGAATADAIYGAIGAFGLTAVTQIFTTAATPLALFGGLFLIWMGYQLLRTSANTKAASLQVGTSNIQAFISTMALTLANPMTILSFIAVFSALSGSMMLNTQSAMTMVTGVFLGSAIWWLMLSTSVSIIRHKIHASTIELISKAAGVLLLGFGGWQILSVVL